MPEPSADFPPSIGPYRVSGVLGRRHPATAYKAANPADPALAQAVIDPFAAVLANGVFVG